MTNKKNDMDAETEIHLFKLKAVETRKKWKILIRFILSTIVFSIFLILLYILFFQQVAETYRDIVNILVGSFTAVIGAVTQYWFKIGEDDVDSETKQLSNI
jgi:hypothetical protein|tara:strand:- start:240 stop:542 length:303 start_codon:yes stop_codon:yes gene_type:complete